jgi:inner membrane transporter RhtA
VLLFARVEVLGVAWLRIASAALIFALWRAPLRTFLGLDCDGRRLLLGWGAVLALMNCCFYLAIDRLPLGSVAAIEFLPVIALAALGARTARNAAALALAVPGVYLLTDVQLQADPLGVAFAGANAVLFAAYIVLGHRVSRLGDGGGISGLAAAMAIAAVIATPIGGWEAVPSLASPVVLAAGVGVGIASSVIPYVTDQLAMARLERATYALLVSLLPATATVIGVFVLGQIPSAVEVAGVALVVAGVAIHREPGDSSERPDDLAYASKDEHTGSGAPARRGRPAGPLRRLAGRAQNRLGARGRSPRRGADHRRRGLDRRARVPQLGRGQRA